MIIYYNILYKYIISNNHLILHEYIYIYMYIHTDLTLSCTSLSICQHNGTFFMTFCKD